MPTPHDLIGPLIEVMLADANLNQSSTNKPMRTTMEIMNVNYPINTVQTKHSGAVDMWQTGGTGSACDTDRWNLEMSQLQSWAAGEKRKE